MAPWCLCKQNEETDNSAFKDSIADLLVLAAICIEFNDFYKEFMNKVDISKTNLKRN